MIPHVKNENQITVFIDGRPISYQKKEKFEEIIEACYNDDKDFIVNLCDKKKQIINSTIFSVDENDKIHYNGYQVPDKLCVRIMFALEQNNNADHIVKFIEKVLQNPSFDVIERLYDFLQATNIPITEDGNFLTYKKIRENYTDIRTGTFDNSIGRVVEIPRNMVDPDNKNTCSEGLHVCSWEYLNHFAYNNNDRVVICSVNPTDVVAIPDDYDNTKMRVCKYVVVGEIEDYVVNNTMQQYEGKNYKDNYEEEEDDEFDSYCENCGCEYDECYCE